MPKVEKINVITIGIDDITPNAYNPNEMDDSKFEFLKDYMQEQGYIQPIIVVEDKEIEGRYIIVDGEHRWKAAKVNGITSIQVVLTDMDLKERQIATINTNLIHGELNPAKFGKLLRDMVEGDAKQAVGALAQQIAMDEEEIKAYLKLTENMDMEYEKEIQEAPEMIQLKFNVKLQDIEFYNRCFARVREMYPIKYDEDIIYNLCMFFITYADDESLVEED